MNPERDLTAGRFRLSNNSLELLACFRNLGAILSSTFFVTRYTVEPTLSSRGPRSSRDKPLSIVAIFRFLGRTAAVSRLSSSSSSLDESVRNSAGSRLGIWTLSTRRLRPDVSSCAPSFSEFSSSLAATSTGPSVSFSVFLRSSACCLKSASLCCRLRFCAAACLERSQPSVRGSICVFKM